MRAIVVTDLARGTVELVQRSAPRPGPGDLLVRVRAAGVNPVDWKLRSGTLGRLAGRFMPDVPGLDVAGVVEEAGLEAAGDPALAPGTRVLGMTRRGGGFAELALVHRTAAARIPDGLGFEEAAAIPVAGLTALQALRDLAALTAGQRLLCNGAAGGVGTFAVQLGRVLGARVTAVTSAGNAELVSSLGAERIIDYAREDFTQPPGEYQVILDAVANRTFSACAPRLTRGGVYITTLPGPANLAWVALSRLGLAGGKRAVIASVKPTGADLAYLARLAVEGKIRSVLDRVLPLAEAQSAFAQSRGGHVRGKLVLSLGAG